MSREPKWGDPTPMPKGAAERYQSRIGSLRRKGEDGKRINTCAPPKGSK